MESATHRILDANFNRAREGLRVMEEYARFALNDAATSEAIKNARHALTTAVKKLNPGDMLTNRDTPGDVGTQIANASEASRKDLRTVAQAAAGRVSEALRCLEEYGKLVSAEAAAAFERLRYEHYAIEQMLVAIAPRMKRLRDAKLHVLLTESLCACGWRETAEQVLAAGADVIQLREKSLSDSVLLDRARVLRDLTRQHDALLVINDRPDIARLADADAVHLGQEDLPIADARQIAGPTILIGGSAHDAKEIERMLSAGVDYLGVGPMFASGTKPDVTVRGPELLALAAELTTTSAGRSSDSAADEQSRHAESSANPTPLVAIGGITPENAASLPWPENTPVAVAVSGAIIGSADPADAIRRMLAAISGVRGTRSTADLDSSATLP